MTRFSFLLLLLWPLASNAQGPLAAPSSSVLAPEASEWVRAAVEAPGGHPALADVYADREFVPIWTRPGDIRRLSARLDDAMADGLTREELSTAPIRALGAAADVQSRARRDVLLTDGLLRLADALLGRRVDPERIHDGHWHLTREARRRRATTPEDVLRAPLASEDPVTATLLALDALQPSHPEYHALRQRLRHLLTEAVDLEAIQAASTRRAETRAEYPEVPLQQLDHREITLLRLNLERWRWLPRDFGDAHVLVNVPAATLWLREASGEKHETVLEMAATIGQPEPDWQTPVLSDPIRSVAFFPTWTPTITIQRREILPQARLDGGLSLYEKGFTVTRGGRTYDPREVNWDRARAGQYRIVQRGGPQGALGRVKFVMPNRHWILIHDTNTPEEFASGERALSHGCVRAEDPGALADAILTRTNGWADGRASGLIDGTPRSRGVRLRERFPVHLVYFTAWAAEDGGVQIHEDVYGRDRELALALGLTLSARGQGI